MRIGNKDIFFLTLCICRYSLSFTGFPPMAAVSTASERISDLRMLNQCGRFCHKRASERII